MFCNRQEYEKMAEVESKHWWYKTLHSMVLKAIEFNFKDKEISILDAGCGTGGLIKFLKNKGYKNIEGFDVSEVAVSLCKSRGINAFIGDIRHTDIITNNKYDVIISNDTMYFYDQMEIHKKIIISFYKVLKENGVLILNLPALKICSGIHDVAVGGRYRFTKKDIKKIIDKDSFCIQNALYWPFLVSPIIIIMRTMQRMKLKLYGDKIEIKSDINLPPKWLNCFLYNLIQFEKLFFLKKLFASSLFFVLKKFDSF